MQLVERGEILGLKEYEDVRPHFRARVIALKKQRRLALGPNVTLVFENHDTVLLQVQEMLRTERISNESAIQHEIDTYNDLIAKPGHLSATAMIEYPDPAQRDAMLEKLVGVETKFFVEFAGERCFSESDLRTVKAERTTAVHYLRFPLSESVRSALQAQASGVAVGIDHAAYQARVELDRTALASLAEDLE
ncbi:MAG: DUF3501 family protein [Myxococcales bacterium]|nr:DUF3501 family protein [Myxococcales bacterium]